MQFEAHWIAIQAVHTVHMNKMTLLHSYSKAEHTQVIKQIWEQQKYFEQRAKIIIVSPTCNAVRHSIDTGKITCLPNIHTWQCCYWIKYAPNTTKKKTTVPNAEYISAEPSAWTLNTEHRTNDQKLQQNEMRDPHTYTPPHWQNHMKNRMLRDVRKSPTSTSTSTQHTHQ